MQCSSCNYDKTFKHGKVSFWQRQRYFCPSCKTTFISKPFTGRPVITLIGLSLSFTFAALFYLTATNNVVFYGVPSSVVIQLLTDEAAFLAYMRGRNVLLHDRLKEMGIEEQMKDFYRSKIADEVLLDQHIHQILYDRTGYVGDAYQVNEKGQLVLRSSMP